MRLRTIATIVALTVTLAGCFTSPTPLISAANASYPFETLVLRGDDGAEITIGREDDHYVYVGDDEGIDLYLLEYEAGLYLLQLSTIGEDGTAQQLYAVVHIDTVANTVSLYRTIVRDEDFEQGIDHCVENGEELYLACLPDGQPLIDIAKAAIAAGEETEGTYGIIRMD